MSNDITTPGWDRSRSHGYCRKPPLVGIGEPSRPVEIPRNTILLGDALEQLRTLPDNSLDCCVSSPPYYGLRSYGIDGQLGLEDNVSEWVSNLLQVFGEVRRVLKPAGSLWLNLGDSFSKGSGYGAPAKSMLCAPERLLVALAKDGWIVRSKVIWSKPNALPNSVADRLNLDYEVIYHLVRSPRYFFTLDAIREPYRSRHAHLSRKPVVHASPSAEALASDNQACLHQPRPNGQPDNRLGKNPGSIWSIPTKGFHGPHLATFPPDLIRRPILATCPEAICTRCGTPWKRHTTVTRMPVAGPPKVRNAHDRHVMRFNERWHVVREVGELVPCGCGAPTVEGVVLDCFMGAGTVGVVAEQLRRDWLGIELSPTYRDMALRRIEEARRAQEGHDRD